MRNYWLNRHDTNEASGGDVANNIQSWSIAMDVIREIREEEDAKAWAIIEDACGYEITMTTDDGHSFHEEITIPDGDVDVEICMPPMAEIRIDTTEV
jgi:hypothetical protein